MFNLIFDIITYTAFNLEFDLKDHRNFVLIEKPK